jgi:23S rRNA (uridine2552-2'-O)-methyltransferase
MAPNMSGIAVTDQARSIYLCELAIDFCLKVLSPKGAFVVKVFHGSGFETFLKMMRDTFVQVKSRKPEASRSESKEVYLIAKVLKRH